VSRDDETLGRRKEKRVIKDGERVGGKIKGRAEMERG
jgi:hypothetical protein